MNAGEHQPRTAEREALEPLAALLKATRTERDEALARAKAAEAALAEGAQVLEAVGRWLSTKGGEAVTDADVSTIVPVIERAYEKVAALAGSSPPANEVAPDATTRAGDERSSSRAGNRSASGAAVPEGSSPAAEAETPEQWADKILAHGTAPPSVAASGVSDTTR